KGATNRRKRRRRQPPCPALALQAGVAGCVSWFRAGVIRGETLIGFSTRDNKAALPAAPIDSSPPSAYYSIKTETSKLFRRTAPSPSPGGMVMNQLLLVPAPTRTDPPVDRYPPIQPDPAEVQ